MFVSAHYHREERLGKCSWLFIDSAQKRVLKWFKIFCADSTTKQYILQCCYYTSILNANETTQGRHFEKVPERVCTVWSPK